MACSTRDAVRSAATAVVGLGLAVTGVGMWRAGEALIST
jgi:hypothetical protein